MNATTVDAHKHCDLCESTRFERIAELDRKQQPLNTVICQRCGLIAHEQIPSERELAEFYRADYREDYHGETTPSPRRVMRAWRNGARIYRQLSDYIVNGDDVFEVGAGIGCTVKQFEQNGCMASGIEPHSGFQAYSAEKLKTQVAQGSLFDLAPKPSRDVILLVHVIEHFRSPFSAMLHLNKLLRHGGLLYIECPNVGAPFAMRDKLFHFAHIHNFTARTLTMMAERTGFEAIASFKRPDDQALEILFRKAAPSQPDYDGSYQETMAALDRHTWASYHLRPRYLWNRVHKLTGYLTEHLIARPYVSNVLAQCKAATRTNERRAA